MNAGVMVERRGRLGGRSRGVVALIVVVLAIAALSGCENVLQAILGDIPTNVKATQGDHTDRIVITWNAVEATSGGSTFSHYIVQRRVWLADSGSWDTPEISTWPQVGGNITDTKYSDSVTPGVAYQYRVRAIYTNPDKQTLPSSIVEGYAINATRLTVYSNSTAGVVSAPADRWFTWNAQRGWTYTITKTGDNTIKVYAQGDIRNQVSASSNRVTATQSGLYYIRLSGNSGTIGVSY